uniref:Putative secreted protein n=1 Tax=Anopheles marajoara TaxID=58244 RepID=A0A2M4CD43_9DIPT
MFPFFFPFLIRYILLHLHSFPACPSEAFAAVWFANLDFLCQSIYYQSKKTLCTFARDVLHPSHTSRSLPSIHPR